ncbi:hypothetical protein T12_6527 [Trichinella patagoniensis]|uniref:Uncharacterized protein n=1 Tax=Trichinella patagoniensis TaxID=990121 RepID=A0A0V0Z7R4_9BILA|nr:hypothetical protein T12_6527 [Trichinella patagoniensis]
MSVGIPYVQFYGAFIVQCPRPHLRQQRQQKMKKPDLISNACASRFQPLKSSSTNRAVFNANHYKMLETEEMDLVELDDAYKCNWVIWFAIFRLVGMLRTEDIMRLAYTSIWHNNNSCEQERKKDWKD